MATLLQDEKKEKKWLEELNQKAEINNFNKEASKQYQKQKDTLPDLDEIERQSAVLDLETRKNFFRQIRRFRTVIFSLLIILMVLETIALFAIVIFSALPVDTFSSIPSTQNDTASYQSGIKGSTLLEIDPGTLKIIVGATITQICIMVIWIIRSVFPPNIINIMGEPK